MACHDPSCRNTITITESITTNDLSTPISLRLCQDLSFFFRSNTTLITISTMIPLQDTASIQEVNTSNSSFEHKKYSVIGGDYDDGGGEVFIEGDKKAVYFVRCSAVWRFVVKCVKKGAGAKIKLDFE